jgi:hypothetical protein
VAPEKNARDQIRDAIWRLDFASLSADRQAIPNEYDALVSVAFAALKSGAEVNVAVKAIVKILAIDWGIRLTPDEQVTTAEALSLAYRFGTQGERQAKG